MMMVKSKAPSVTEYTVMVNHLFRPAIHYAIGGFALHNTFVDTYLESSGHLRK